MNRNGICYTFCAAWVLTSCCLFARPTTCAAQTVELTRAGEVTCLRPLDQFPSWVFEDELGSTATRVHFGLGGGCLDPNEPFVVTQTPFGAQCPWVFSAAELSGDAQAELIDTWPDPNGVMLQYELRHGAEEIGSAIVFLPGAPGLDARLTIRDRSGAVAAAGTLRQESGQRWTWACFTYPVVLICAAILTAVVSLATAVLNRPTPPPPPPPTPPTVVHVEVFHKKYYGEGNRVIGVDITTVVTWSNGVTTVTSTHIPYDIGDAIDGPEMDGDPILVPPYP